MSAAPAVAAAPGDVTDIAPAVRNNKKLILGAAALAVLLAAGAAGAYVVVKKRAAAAAAAVAADDGNGPPSDAPAVKVERPTLKQAPTFVPLEPFTVNLADRETERYAQVGITLELADAKAGDLLKAYMPAIRNNILLALGAKTAPQLIERDGKVRLAAEIRREALRPLGYIVDLAPAAEVGDTPKKPGRGDDDSEVAPIRAVHFSNFIIQ